jgi:hypothetical protein
MIVHGDIQLFPTTLICHQTNCKSKCVHILKRSTVRLLTSLFSLRYALGLAKSLFKKFPYADIYKMRNGSTSTVGTIDVRGIYFLSCLLFLCPQLHFHLHPSGLDRNQTYHRQHVRADLPWQGPSYPPCRKPLMTYELHHLHRRQILV